MKDSLLRLIDVLETKREAAEKIEKSTAGSRLPKAVMENMFCSGVVESMSYAIKELKKVVDDL